MRRALRTVLTTAALLAAGTAVFAQATSGRISGTVMDAQGGLLPGATVTATEVRTGYVRTAVTDAQGSFVFVSLPLGTYSVSAEVEGFKKEIKTGYTLVADGRLTADFRLAVGGINESVEVTVPGETVNTTSGEIARTVDRNQVQNLALNGRNYLQLATLIPGAPELNTNALDIMTGLGINTSINGSRTNASLLTVDGGFNMDSGSNNSQISNVGVDFIEEVSIKTANFSAEYGRNSGAAINVVTRTGTNELHGSAFEYLRNDSLDANSTFNNARNVAKPHLKYNDFGGALGGPIQKDKLFFFVGVEWKQIDRFTSPSPQTLPDSRMRSGDFSELSTAIKDPLTGQPFPGNVIPAGRITPDGQAIANLYAKMSTVAQSYTDTATANNALFQQANPFRWRQEMIRLDYNLSSAHRLTGRLMLDHYTLTDPYGTFIGGNLPTVPTDRNRPGRNVQLNHSWTISPRLLNDAKFNYSGNGQHIDPVGDAWARSTYGFQYPQLYPSGGTFEDSIPQTSISGYAGWHGANEALISPTKDFALADTLTWLSGAHTVKTGVLGIYNTKKQNGRSNYTGLLNFSTSGNSKTTGNAFADALLGNFRSYSEAQLDPIGLFRFWQLEAFVTDDWRLGRDLSVELGVRYTYHYPTYTAGNNLTSFDPSRYDPAQAVTLNTNGTIVPGSGNRYNGLVRPGEVPADQVPDVPNANSDAVKSIPIASSRGIYDPQHLFMPRFSFAWTPGGSGRTSVRGGVGLFYDRPEGNLYFSLPNNPPFALSSEYQNGNLSNPGGGTAAALAPWASIDSLDPDLKMPRSWNWSVSLQRELPWWGLFGEVAYVGSKGQNLIRQPDINLPSFADLEANAAGPKYSTNYLRPFKGYSNIRMRLSDASSSYHALQVFLSKRRGDLKFTLNYTLGRAYDNGTGNGDNLVAGGDPLDLGYYWGPSDIDRTHIFVGTWSYSLPFFREDKGVLGYALGGWELSGITRYQSGAPLTVTATTSIGNRRADYLGGDPYVDQRIANGNEQWLNPDVFAAAPEGRLGNSKRGQFRGPAYYVWDISLRKQFRVGGDVRLQLQADFFNAFNRTNWGNANNNVQVNMANAAFGTVTAVNPPRNIQLGLRLMF
jgi:hypothetical protein